MNIRSEYQIRLSDQNIFSRQVEKYNNIKDLQLTGDYEKFEKIYTKVNPWRLKINDANILQGLQHFLKLTITFSFCIIFYEVKLKIREIFFI